ncbi:hypothetical protein PGT21_030033 [Puccinia graminis f. sp. tritici]|uniref:Uncharacterized protein n=1 Tax=Puccinia graminis f. sp. tritici TaxID=56615 RepID=A0A5B0MR21_PUCGR|nr:hypothetical protein PGT21_030033 [Puccinia graminis f. sp. tritici]KAA1078514.1 hypothetical protein PGTUg99_002440 [Puccinia graminis f. sp. tritici]
MSSCVRLPSENDMDKSKFPTIASRRCKFTSSSDATCSAALKKNITLPFETWPARAIEKLRETRALAVADVHDKKIPTMPRKRNQGLSA